MLSEFDGRYQDDGLVCLSFPSPFGGLAPPRIDGGGLGARGGAGIG